MTYSKLKQKLQHPMALVGQGFVAGAILFWATAPSESQAHSFAPTAAQVQATR